MKGGWLRGAVGNASLNSLAKQQDMSSEQELSRFGWTSADVHWQGLITRSLGEQSPAGKRLLMSVM